MKSFVEHTQEERKAIFDKLAGIYEKHGHPSWLSAPKVISQCVNDLSEGKQENQDILMLEAKVPLEQKELAKTVSDEINEAVSTIVEKQVKVACELGPGATMDPLEDAHNVFEDKVGTVKHEPGQVLLLDFWATWCPPCQQPMAHNQAMLEKRGADWGDKVRLIGLSIDQAADTVKNHVEAKGWTKVEHWWIRNGKCTADKEYGIKGVPHVALVDTNGKIVFKGHPANRKDLEADIDALLKGEKLTGEGTGAAGIACEEDPNAAGKDISAEAAKFKQATAAKLDELKPMAEGMIKAFLVLVNETTMNMKTRKNSDEGICHCVLVGPKEKVDQLSSAVEVLKKGPWENKNQIMAR